MKMDAKELTVGRDTEKLGTRMDAMKLTVGVDMDELEVRMNAKDQPLIVACVH